MNKELCIGMMHRLHLVLQSVGFLIKRASTDSFVERSSEVQAL